MPRTGTERFALPVTPDAFQDSAVTAPVGTGLVTGFGGFHKAAVPVGRSKR